MTRTTWSLLVWLVPLALGGCWDSSRTPPDHGPLDVAARDAGPDKKAPDRGPAPDQGPTNGPLTISVYEGNAFKWEVSRKPFAGATVAFDLPGGTRVEKTTGADGKATVDSVVWSKGAVTVTGHAKGMRPVSFLGIRKQDGDQEMWLFPVAPAWVPVTGKAINMDAAAKYFAGAATVPSKPIVYGLGTYETGVPPGVPFAMVGMQYDVDLNTVSKRDRLFKIPGWCRKDSPGITAAATLDVDCATKLPVTQWKATLTLPTDPKSLLRTSSQGAAIVTDYDSAFGSFLGYASKATIAADGNSFAIEAEHVALAGVQEPVTLYLLTFGAWQNSWVLAPGAPKDGATVGGFLEQPVLVKPAAPSTPAALAAPIEWTSAETVSRTTLTIWRGNPNTDLESLWSLWVMPGTTQVVLPEPPSSLDLGAFLGPDPVYGQVGLCDWDATKLNCKRSAGGKLFKLQPPLPTCSPDKWCIVKTGVTGMSFSWIWGSGASDVFIGGSGGKVVRYDGASFTAMSTPVTVQLNSGWGSGPKDVFAVGQDGTILHYDGTAWSVQASGTTEHLARVWGSSSKDVFAVGAKGTVLHYDGTAWSKKTPGVTDDLWGVWGSGPQDVFVTGSAGTILHHDGAAWSKMTSGTTDRVRAIWGLGPKDVYAVGGTYAVNAPSIFHYDGTAWSAVYTAKHLLLQVWGADAKTIFAVGQENGPAVMRYDGTSWATMDPGTGLGTVTGVWGPSASEVYIVAAGTTGTGLLLRYKP
jgi:hypothetical protein